MAQKARDFLGRYDCLGSSRLSLWAAGSSFPPSSLICAGLDWLQSLLEGTVPALGESLNVFMVAIFCAEKMHQKRKGYEEKSVHVAKEFDSI
jgi:hypothetical protein